MGNHILRLASKQKGNYPQFNVVSIEDQQITTNYERMDFMVLLVINLTKKKKWKGNNSN